MLQKLGDHIAAAKHRAALCRERLLTVADDKLKTDLEDMERAWFDLAKHFQTLKSSRQTEPLSLEDTIL